PVTAALAGRGTARALLFELEPARADLARAADVARTAPLAPHETARARARDGALVLLTLAEVERARGDATAARVALEDACREDPSSPEAEIALARLDLEQQPPQDLSAAAQRLQSALAKAPRESRDAASALE